MVVTRIRATPWTPDATGRTPAWPAHSLGFSDRQPGEWGRVHKLTRAEIEASFAEGWRIDSIEPSTIDITTDPGGIQAWLVALTRI